MPPKKKRLTQREKAGRSAIKKQLQKDGLLPPDKPRLNRKKFARETWAEYEEFFQADTIRAEFMLIKAIGYMVGPDMEKVTSEEIGVLKLLKIAVELDRFFKGIEAEGRSTYSLKELADKVVLPIYKL